MDVRSDPLTREETGAMFNESYWTNNRDGFRKYFKSFHHPSQYEFFPTPLYVIICFEWYPLKYSVPPSARTMCPLCIYYCEYNIGMEVYLLPQSNEVE